MGLYNTYGNVQIKCGNYEEFKTYEIGDKCDLRDGIYIGHGGAIVIKGGIFIVEFPDLNDKWGNLLNCSDIINNNHPLEGFLKMKNEEEKIKLIENWLYDFPCKEFFDESCCILEFFDRYEIYNLILKKLEEYKKEVLKPLTDKEIKELGL